MRRASGRAAATNSRRRHHRAAVEGAVRDDELCDEIMRVFGDNYRVYGARKVWRQLLREDVPVPRCTIERLMRRLGLQGARRGKIAARPRPTRPSPASATTPTRRPTTNGCTEKTPTGRHPGFRHKAQV
jgi:transposase InsO family protein